MSRTPEVPSQLIDGRARSKAYPDTFLVPDAETIASLMPRDYVKIGLERADGAGERFWVLISRIEGQGDEALLIGTIDNDLVRFPEYPHGATIAFHPRHILGILEH